MSVKGITGNDVNKGEGLLLATPEMIVIHEELRGRHTAVSAEAIQTMAESILLKGQMTPVEVRKATDPEGNKNRLTLTSGFTRYGAICLIREGFIGTDGEKKHDPDRLVECKLVECNDQEAFERNIEENLKRNQTSFVDDAFNQQVLRERYQKKDKEIAAIYQYKGGQTMVTKLKSLLQLEQAILDLVHAGRLSLDGAIDLIEVPSKQRMELITAAKREGSDKINGSKLRTLIREEILKRDPNADIDEVTPNEDAETGSVTTVAGVTPVVASDKAGNAETTTTTSGGTTTTTTKPKNGNGNTGSTAVGIKPRSVKEIKDFLAKTAKDLEGSDIETFCNKFVEFMNGSKTDRSMLTIMKKLMNAAVPEETE